MSALMSHRAPMSVIPQMYGFAVEGKLHMEGIV